MLKRSIHLPPEHLYPTDPWRVVETAYSPVYAGRTETAFALSNGYVGIRGTFHKGPWGDNGFIEDYTAEVRGRPLGCFHLVTFNADGRAQHIAAHYRPLSSLLFFSRLLRESLAGTPYAGHFLAGAA